MGKKKVGKESAKKEIESGKKKLRKKQEKQLKVFLIIMLSLLIFIFIAYVFVQASLKFRYAGLEFKKVRQGELVLYQTPVFPVFLRNDPRELRDIEVESKILLQKRVGIGGEKELIESCKESVVAAASLAIFYGRTGLETFSATTNKEEAKEQGIELVDCSLNTNYSAILFESGEESRIEKEANCYILRVKDCEFLEAAERFMVASYAHSHGIEV